MKEFDEWWEEYGKHYKIEFFESITGDAFRAGMLAAADIASEGGDVVKGRGLEWRTNVAYEIRQAAK